MKKISYIAAISISMVAGFVAYAYNSWGSSPIMYNTVPPVIHAKVAAFDEVDTQTLAHELELDKADIHFARKHGGPLTQAFLNQLQLILTPTEFEMLRIDVKMPKVPKGYNPSNTSWHCDFHFTRDPSNPSRMIRPDADIEPQVRHFTLISSTPQTEFWLKPISLDFWQGEDWEPLQEKLAEIIEKKDVVKIPPAHIVEFRGNNIHRSTTHIGPKVILRYFIRASLFPPGHRMHKKDIRNTIRHRFAYKNKQ